MMNPPKTSDSFRHKYNTRSRTKVSRRFQATYLPDSHALNAPRSADVEELLDSLAILSLLPDGDLELVEQELGKDIDTFTCFKRLPFELRRMIWKLSIPGPRIVDITGAIPEIGWGNQLNTGRSTPTGFLVCRESRQVVMETYRLIRTCRPTFLNSKRGSRFSIVDPKKDVVYISRRIFSRGRRWARYLAPEPWLRVGDTSFYWKFRNLQFLRSIELLEITNWLSAPRLSIGGVGCRIDSSRDDKWLRPEGPLKWFPVLRELRVTSGLWGSEDCSYVWGGAQCRCMEKHLVRRFQNCFRILAGNGRRVGLPKIILQDYYRRELRTPGMVYEDQWVNQWGYE